MEEAQTMGPDDSNESRHSLPMGVGNDKRMKIAFIIARKEIM